MNSGSPVSAERLAALLGKWNVGEGPLSRRLAAVLRRGVESGELAPGTGRPPERKVADAVAVSRTTVISAYERLKREDLLTSRQGSGTWVRVRRGAAGRTSGYALPGSRGASGLLTEPPGGSRAAVVEDPTCIAALTSLRASGARLLPVPVGEGGVDPAAVEEAFARASPRLAYVTPTFNNPTGAVMGALGRRRLAELADRYRIPVVEDLTVAGLALDDAPSPPPPIAAYAEAGAPVLSVGSMSKLFWAGLRVGWIRGPAPTIARLTHLKTVADLGTSLPAQLHAARLLPRAAEASAERQEQLMPHRDRLIEMLSERLPSWDLRRPRGGLSLWVRLPQATAPAFAQAMQRRGVLLAPGTTFSVDERHEDHLRLQFVPESGSLALGVEQVAQGWHSHHGTTTPKILATTDGPVV